MVKHSRAWSFRLDPSNLLAGKYKNIPKSFQAAIVNQYRFFVNFKPGK